MAPPVQFRTSPASGSADQSDQLSSPRCSSTSLSPKTPLLKISYKSLNRTESRAVLATLHNTGADSCPSSREASRKGQTSPPAAGVLQLHQSPTLGSPVLLGHRWSVIQDSGNELRTKSSHPVKAVESSSPSESSTTHSLNANTPYLSPELRSDQQNDSVVPTEPGTLGPSVEVFTAKLLAAGLGDEAKTLSHSDVSPGCSDAPTSSVVKHSDQSLPTSVAAQQANLPDQPHTVTLACSFNRQKG